MSEEKQWHSWVIRRNRLQNVITYIRDNCPEIDKFFYPEIKKEYTTRGGKPRIKDAPLYEGYIFLHYNDHPHVFHKLSNYPQVTTYCGLVEDVEINRMQQAQGKLLSDLKMSKFIEGDTVLLKDGPFKGYDAQVLSGKRGMVRIRVDAMILGTSGHEMSYPEDQIEHKSELQNADVQNI